MKNRTSNLVFSLLLIFSSIVFSQKNERKVSDFVESHIVKMKADIQLSDSQILVMRDLYAILYAKWQISSKSNTREKLVEYMNNDYQFFLNKRDSVLTEEQKIQLLQKANERKENGVDKIGESSVFKLK
jgi:hypothetical protein